MKLLVHFLSRFRREKMMYWRRSPKRDLRTNSSKIVFEKNIRHSKSRLRERGYPNDLVESILTEVDFTNRKTTLQEKNKVRLTKLPFVTQYNSSVTSLKKILLSNWQIIEEQPKLREMYRKLINNFIFKSEQRSKANDENSNGYKNHLHHYCYYYFYHFLLCIFALHLKEEHFANTLRWQDLLIRSTDAFCCYSLRYFHWKNNSAYIVKWEGGLVLEESDSLPSRSNIFIIFEY